MKFLNSSAGYIIPSYLSLSKQADFNSQPDFSLKQNLPQLAALLAILPVLIPGSRLQLEAAREGPCTSADEKQTFPSRHRLRPYVLH